MKTLLRLASVALVGWVAASPALADQQGDVVA